MRSLSSIWITSKTNHCLGPVYFKERDENIAKWLHEGTFKAKESVTDGIDNGPEGFVGMLQGKNFGKAVLKIADVEVRDSKLWNEPC